MNQYLLSKTKKPTRITIATSKKNGIIPPFKSLKSILKEKLIYDYLCGIHHYNYYKYCTTCKKDICYQCETESHKNHNFINYENILPDLNEINTIQKGLKEYERNYFELKNIINSWKKDLDKMIFEYEKKINSIMEYITKFNNEKINFSCIYKYRSICSIILNNDNKNNENLKNEKNIKIIELMEKLLNEKKSKENNNNNYIETIQKDYKCLLTNNQLKQLNKSLNNDTFISKIEKIINVIDYKKNNYIINDFNDNKSLNSNYYKNNNRSSYSKNNTTASSLNNYYLTINQNIKENSIFKLNPNSHRTSKDEIDKNNNYSKSTNNINYQTINNNLSIYEKKNVREKSNEYKIHSFIDKCENINNDRHTDYMKTDNIKNKNILQDSINKVEINKNIYRNYISNSNSNGNYNNCRHKIIKRRKKNLFQSNTHNLVNKSLLYDYKGFGLNDKEYSPELLSNSSKTIEGTKYLSTTLRSNSLESRTYKYRQILNIGKLDIYNNNNINNNKSDSNSLDNKHKTLTIERNKSTYGMFSGKMSLNDKNYKTINYNILSTYNKNNFNKNIFNRNLEKTLQYDNKSFNNSYGNYLKHKINNSVLNINSHNNNSYAKNKNNMYNTINSERTNEKLIYNNIYNNKKEKKIYVHKKFVPDDSKNLSCIDSINSSISSTKQANSKNKNKNNDNCTKNDNKYNNTNTTINNEIHINDNKPLFIGFELGNNECKIGVINNKNNFELFNYNNNNYCIPTIISFLENNSNNNNNDKNNDDILIGEEAENVKILNASQTIFNIMKLIGKNTNEIIDKKDLWPFIIYNDEKTNKPYIKIRTKKNENNNNQYTCYNFEEILTIFLKKLFEKFFDKIIIDNVNSSHTGKNNKSLNVYKTIDLNLVVSVPNYYNYLQRKIIEKIFVSKLFPENETYKKSNILIKYNMYGKYNIQLNNIKIESASILASFCLINKEVFANNNNSMNYLIVYIEGCSVNISIINLRNNKNNNNYVIEVKGINGIEFGEEDFLDNYINTCLCDFKDNIKKNCLKSTSSLAKLRKSLNIVKKCFNKEDIIQTEVNITKLYDDIDLKMVLNKNDYIKSCLGQFKKIIYLIKGTILKSNIDIKDINDIILIGGITQNATLKSLISELFKDSNKKIYNKLINKNIEKIEDINNYVILGAIMQCFNSGMTIPKYKLINIINNSFGVEGLNGIMNVVIEKGSNIPIKFNKYVKIKKPENNESNMVCINIYEGDNINPKNNRLISSNLIDNNIFKYDKKDDNSIEVLFQFYIDSNYNLKVYILDKYTFRKKYECLIDIDNIKK